MSYNIFGLIVIGVPSCGCGTGTVRSTFDFDEDNIENYTTLLAEIGSYNTTAFQELKAKIEDLLLTVETNGSHEDKYDAFVQFTEALENFNEQEAQILQPIIDNIEN
ncbi:MAG: hypothetical protein ACK4K0_05215 [Flavobacteriales bacterium]